MKKYILAAFIALAFAPTVGAQYTINDVITDPKYGTVLEFPKENGVQLPAGKDFGYSKNISKPFSNGYYYIKLESFATGSAQLIDKPSDIILVLDVSGSMSGNYGTDTSTDLYPYGFGTSTFGYNGISHDQIKSGTYSGSKIRYNGSFYTVKGLRTGANSSEYRYYLYFETTENDPTTRHWLKGYDIVDTQPEGATKGNTPIFYDRLWREKRKAKMDALKEAVNEFIRIINQNDLYATDKDGNLVPRDERLGNRISIVKFANAAYYSEDHLVEGNHRGPTPGHTSLTYSANYTELVKNVTALDNGGKEALENAIEGLVEGSSTAADCGLTIANEVLNQASVKNRDSNKVIVFFTDGEPNHSDGFVGDVANAAVSAANTAKKTYGATIFSVGVFGSTVNNNTHPYMERVSSDYKNATTYQNGTQVDTKYYKRADNNLVEVFADIARQAGGSQGTLSAATSNVDVVSNSFILPEGTNAQNIGDKVKVFTAPLTSIDEHGNYIFGTETLAGHQTLTYDLLDEDGNVLGTYPFDKVHDPAYPTDYTKSVPIKVELVGTNGIKVTNFDYSSNWCGPEKNQAHQVIGYHGAKIIILIPILMNPDAVGGPNVETNAPGSGVFSKATDTTPFVEFVSPKVSLPVNIYIEKKGLKNNESARFRIERAVIPESGKIEDIAPDAWEFVTTVFVTNSADHAKFTTDNNPVVKVRGLAANKTEDEGFIYRVSEEGWSWSYTGNTPAQYTDTQHIENPFTFDNTPITAPTDARSTIKHAESKVKNVFKGENGTKEYDDSKTNTD